MEAAPVETALTKPRNIESLEDDYPKRAVRPTLIVRI